MYVYMCVCVRVRACACVRVYKYVQITSRHSACTRAFCQEYTYIHTHTHACMHACMHAFIHTLQDRYMYMYMYTYIDACRLTSVHNTLVSSLRLASEHCNMSRFKSVHRSRFRHLLCKAACFVSTKKAPVIFVPSREGAVGIARICGA
jgi:hypothetical protein